MQNGVDLVEGIIPPPPAAPPPPQPETAAATTAHEQHQQHPPHNDNDRNHHHHHHRVVDDDDQMFHGVVVDDTLQGFHPHDDDDFHTAFNMTPPAAAVATATTDGTTDLEEDQQNVVPSTTDTVGTDRDLSGDNNNNNSNTVIHTHKRTWEEAVGQTEEIPHHEASSSSASPPPTAKRHKESFTTSIETSNNQVIEGLSGDDSMGNITTTTAAAETAAQSTTTSAAAAAAAAASAASTNKQWDAMLERLIAFKQRNGHCLVPKRYAEDPKLGTWVETQRVQYKRLQREYDETRGVESVQPNKRLNHERLRKLNDVGFVWSAKHVRKAPLRIATPVEGGGGGTSAPPTRKFSSFVVDAKGAATNPDANFSSLIPHNMTILPAGVMEPTAGGAGGAMSTQHHFHHPYHPLEHNNNHSAGHAIPSTAPKPPPQPPTTAAAPRRKSATGNSGSTGGGGGSSSNSANNNPRLNDQQWEDMYQRLVRYKQIHGDCLVPRKYEHDPKLSTWVETQRFLWNRDYRNAANASPSSQQDGGTNGEPTATAASNDAPTSADTAVATETVPPTPESQLDTASTSFGHLPDPVVAQNSFSHLPWTSDLEDAAVVAAAAAAAAEAVDGEVDLSTTNQPEPSSPQVPPPAPQPSTPAPPRRLTKERKEKLDALGFVWSLRNKRIEDHWDEMFRQLLEYKETHGDCLVPSRYEANLKLGKWVETQRYEYTKLKRAEAGLPLEKSQEEKSDGKPRATNARLTDERLRRLGSIGFEWKVRNKMKRYYDKQWQDMFDLLLEFKAKNGHTMVPKRYPENPRLANWVHTQRIQYRKLQTGGAKKDEGESVPEESVQSNEVKLSKEDEISFRLTEDRRRKLEEIGFVWSVRESEAKATESRIVRNSYDDQWDLMYERLKAYKEKHGNCLIPKRSKEDPKLGTWVDTQRVQYKKLMKKLADQTTGDIDSKPSTEEQESKGPTSKPVVGRLTEDRIQRLNALGFVWSLRDDWDKHYDELKQFKNQHGHCNVPARYAANRRLGIWVSAQRQQYKLMQLNESKSGAARAPLTQERIDLLNQLGFTWTIRSRDILGESWNQRFQELREYKRIHGNCLVPSRYPPNQELGTWVGTQRTQYRLLIKERESGQKIPGTAGMSEERIRLLEELGFVWALRGQEGGRRDSEPRPVSVEPLEPIPQQLPLHQESHSQQESQRFTQQQGHHNPEAILDEPSVMAAYQQHVQQNVHEV